MSTEEKEYIAILRIVSQTNVQNKAENQITFRITSQEIEGGTGMDYHGSRWKHKSKKILRRDKYVDRVAAMYGTKKEANMVHHIFPADEYPEYAWCDWNLISVSFATHNALENRQTGELTEKGLRLQRMTRKGVGVVG